ncbi:DNA-binding protein P3A2-like isoform X2 [Macrosteles quadrilineatus]|uniref:DNA-binding protein P3A2-like isoform X2 n=1 Tax=Macrosteles quadrilineatus TaxID=74068 RepID=UPI0023E27163|nr:DNA-binding protein P3A2-like isoform X2 [Macrosteles quadrilineatus]
MMDTTAPEPLSLAVHSDENDDDIDDGCMSSQSSEYGDDGDLSSGMADEVTAQLAAAGPVGMAAAAAIMSAKKRKRPHSFETNPSIRKRQQNRLLRKLRQTIDEFATRVGQQAVVLVATPGKPSNSYKCFGAKPLEDIVKNLRTMIMEELETALAQQAPPPVQDDPSLYELPPLVIDGIPTPVEKMTQAQLRAFIPLMLKYSTGRVKPGWGRESTKPPWWPVGLPWANVRMDARSEESKHKISWTHALQQIVINCYKYHGREDLLPGFNEDEEGKTGGGGSVMMSGGTGGVIRLHKAPSPSPTLTDTQSSHMDSSGQQVTTQYTPAVLQTISNPDGTLSIIQVDPNNPIITLPDGTTAHVQGVATIQAGSNEQGTIHTLHTGEGGGVAVDLSNVTEATLNQDGQLILTGDDGQSYPVTVSGMISVPVSGGMYQTVVANIQHIQGSDGTMQVITPMCHVPKVEPGSEGEGVETITHQLVNIAGEPQMLQVLSLKEPSGDKPQEVSTITSG